MRLRGAVSIIAAFTRPQARFSRMASLAHSDDDAPTTSVVAALPKIFEASLAVVPPDDEAVWEPLQRARTEARDAGILRWPPHCNVLYPFVPPKHFPTLGPLLRDALATMPPFEVVLAEFASFDRPSSSVLYLAPTASWVNSSSGGASGGGGDVDGDVDGAGGALVGVDPFQELYRRVAAVAPYCDNKNKPFVPHFTVTHTAGAAESAAVRDALLEWWEPVRFTVSEVHCVSRKGPSSPFELRWRIPLGTASAAAAAATAVVDNDGGGGDGAAFATSSSGDGRVAGPGGGGAVPPEDAAYRLMASAEGVTWAAEARRGLAERRKRGQRRKHRNSAAGKVEKGGGGRGGGGGGGGGV